MADHAVGLPSMVLRQRVFSSRKVSTCRPVEDGERQEEAPEPMSTARPSARPFPERRDATPAANRAKRAGAAWYWKWSATNEYRWYATLKKPTRGERSRPKANAAASGPRPIRPRSATSATSRATPAGKRNCTTGSCSGHRG